MIQKASQPRRGRGPQQPLITKELERLREKPPRNHRVPLSNLDRLAILNGIRDGDAPTSCIRVAKGKFRNTCALVNQNLSVKVAYISNEVYASWSPFQTLPPTEMEEINI